MKEGRVSQKRPDIYPALRSPACAANHVASEGGVWLTPRGHSHTIHWWVGGVFEFLNLI